VLKLDSHFRDIVKNWSSEAVHNFLRRDADPLIIIDIFRVRSDLGREEKSSDSFKTFEVLPVGGTMPMQCRGKKRKRCDIALLATPGRFWASEFKNHSFAMQTSSSAAETSKSQTRGDGIECCLKNTQ